jgi:hypothetical protein
MGCEIAVCAEQQPIAKVVFAWIHLQFCWAHWNGDELLFENQRFSVALKQKVLNLVDATLYGNQFMVNDCYRVRLHDYGNLLSQRTAKEANRRIPESYARIPES